MGWFQNGDPTQTRIRGVAYFVQFMVPLALVSHLKEKRMGDKERHNTITCMFSLPSSTLQA